MRFVNMQPKISNSWITEPKIEKASARLWTRNRKNRKKVNGGWKLVMGGYLYNTPLGENQIGFVMWLLEKLTYIGSYDLASWTEKNTVISLRFFI